LYKTGIGQDSHRFQSEGKGAVVGGLCFDDAPPLDADSDGDVVFHAICNAITSITHVPILGDLAIKMCHEKGIRDSHQYLAAALKTLKGYQIEHIALTIEGQRPKFQKRSQELRQSVAAAVGIDSDQIGVTFTTGDGMTAFGRGEGLQCFCVISVKKIS